MKTEKPSSVPEYISGFPEKTQKALKQVRSVIKKAAPKAEETISYSIAAFKLNGMLVYFAGWKTHIGMYPVPKGDAAFQKQVTAYRAGKGTLKFPLDKPMPVGLITKLVKFRMKENLERVKLKKKK